jgi:hypothetical protein
MRARTKGLAIGLFVLLVPGLIVIYINYYMLVRHPELLARGTTAVLTAREESSDGFVFHFQVDDPKASPVIQRLSPNHELRFEIRKTEYDAKDWQQLKVGDRFCITYTDLQIQNYVAKCAAAKTDKN